MYQKLKLNARVSKKQIGRRLDIVLVEIFPKYSRSLIKKWIINQYVLVNGAIWDKPKKKVIGEEFIVINVPKSTNLFKPQPIFLNIVYEDKDIIIINKPHNLVIHPGAGNTDHTILNALLYHYPDINNVPRAGIIHRLDKNTTGLMIIAKNIFVQTRLIELLRLRKITREYEAIVIGHIIPEGTINYPIARHPNRRTRMSVNISGKYSITHFRVIEYFRLHTHIRLLLETGRTHQIRVHMSHISHPLVGDKLYGGYKKYPKKLSKILTDKLNKFNRQALHAVTLRIYHPITGIKMEWHAPIPQDMMELIHAMHIDLKDENTYLY